MKAFRSQLRTVLTRGDDDHEVSVTVHYTFHKPREGSRDGRGGLKIEPDEPAHIEIDSVTRNDSAQEDIEITAWERKMIEKDIAAYEHEKSLPPED